MSIGNSRGEETDRGISREQEGMRVAYWGRMVPVIGIMCGRSDELQSISSGEIIANV